MPCQSHRSIAYMPLSGADQAFEQLVVDVEEHDVVLERPGARVARILVGDSLIEVGSDGSGISLKVSAVSQSILYFLKEAAVRYMTELDAPAAEKLRWKDDAAPALNDGVPANFHELTLAAKSEPLPGLIRLRLNAKGNLDVLSGPGIHVKLMLPLHSGRVPVWPKMAANGTTSWPSGKDALHVRYYTIRSADPANGHLDIDIVRHEGGVIAEWAEAASEGDRIGLLGPSGRERPQSGDNVIFAGDQTALPALARMVEDLPEDVSGHLVGEAESYEELRHYLPNSDLVVHAIPPARFQADVLDVCRTVSAGEKLHFAWFAGEYKNAQAMRKFFKSELGLGKGSQFSITYWRKGVSLKAD
ncbi:siderophore-interacting protein [Roseibium sp. SCP14]|uniref:siderophore-interacting protein n=1 Tax=Roseibium sp. SCP14 TaxID=3141375 RepID=UPI00333A14BA